MKFSLPEKKEHRVAYLIAALAVVGAIGIVGSTLTPALPGSGSPESAVYSKGLPTTGRMTSSDTVNRKKATTVHISFSVDSVQDSISETEQLSREYSGIVESTYFNKKYGSSGSISVRIPEENSSVFEDRLSDRWEVKSSGSDTVDVTDQYTRLSLELKNRRQELLKLEELLNKTDDVESLVKVQEQMSSVRSRIQYLETQLKDIDKQTMYVTYNINFEQRESFSSEFEVRKTFADSYHAVFDSLRFIILGIGYLLPFALLYIAYLALKRLRGRLDLI
ncbi:MAG: DUF4349 domain-containing protein [Candidatus Nanohaloarchaea archaeon]